MVLKLAPESPMVWRTPTSVQLGVDSPVIVDDVTPGVERLLAALRSGVSPSGFAMLARDAGVPADTASTLLARLHPVLQGPVLPADVPVASGRVLVTGDGPIATELAALLRADGLLARADHPAPTIAVLVADWVIAPDDAAHWLRRDVPHLPIVTADRSVSVGPFVEPGLGPCIYCVQLARTDVDSAWPAVATQLWGRPGVAHPPLTVSSVACFAARRITVRLADGPAAHARVWRLSERGATVSASTTRTHPRCSCAARPESDWAPGSGRAAPAATTTDSAAVVPG